MVIKRILDRYKMPLGRIICFFIVLFLLTGAVQYRLLYRERYNDNSSYQIIDFYKEEKDAMEAVFIGSSCTFAFYSPLFAYENYGLKTANFSSSGMGMLAYRYAIDEVRKYQKDALIILTITPNYEMQYLGVHFMSDYMPMSLNKIRFLTRYFTQDGESLLNSLGFYFPLMEFHDRWAEVSADDLVLDEGIKGATRHRFYLGTVNDISEYYLNDQTRQEMPDKMAFFMNDLLDHCDEKDENIVFLLPPKAYTADEYQQMNSLADLIKERGYRLLDLRDQFAELGLDMSQDYYDINHTNIHGSIKYTAKMAEYIMNDHECVLGNDEEWDKALAKYHTIIDPYILEDETALAKRDIYLAAPKLLDITDDGKKVSLTWEAVEGADDYVIWRKTDGAYVKIGNTAQLSFQDEVKEGGSYVYTVLSARHEGDRYLSGNYDHSGLSIEVAR